MRILFAGTPDLAVPSLDAVAAEFDVAGVITTPDRETGRGRRRAPSPVAVYAEERGLPVIKADGTGREVRVKVRELEPDILAVVAFGRIFGPKFLSLFPLGGVNLHPSLLPKFRGSSPLSAAILEGVPFTGITVQRLADRMDAGDILAQKVVPLSGRETTGTLTETVAPLGAELMVDVLRRIASGENWGDPQQESEATYCSLVSKEDGIIDWSLPTERIAGMVRAYDPWPRAVSTFAGQDLYLLEAEPLPEEITPPGPCGLVAAVDKARGILIKTGQGALLVTRLQLQAKKPLLWRDFLNGTRAFVGAVLGGTDEDDLPEAE